jgi:molybdenum cofactor cytidylyltransferase
VTPTAVWAGVLAAGAGSRLGGRPKALLELHAAGAGATTFLEAIARSARAGGAAGVAVVLGHHADAVRPLAARVCDLVVVNADPDRGMGSSARVVAAAMPPGAAMLLWPVDVPAVRPATVRALIAQATATPGRVIVPVARGPGHPPLLPPGVVEALALLPDEERLDRFVAAAPAVRLAVDDPGVECDVDVAADLDRFGG